MVTFLLLINADPFPDNPHKQYPEDCKDEKYDTRIQIITFDAAPHFENKLCAVTEITDHGATLHDFTVRVLYRIDLNAVCTWTEEITEVGELFKSRVDPLPP